MKSAAVLLLAFLLAQDELKRPAAIKVQDVPPVPREIYDRLMQYQNVRSAQFRDWTPDARSVLITTRFGSTSQLHLVPAPGNPQAPATFFHCAARHPPLSREGSSLFQTPENGAET